MRRLLPLLALFAGWMLVAAPSAKGPLEGRDVYRLTLHSTAWVSAGRSKGTGWLVARGQRLLLTNLHVVGDQDAVEVVFPLSRDGRVIAERVVYQDEWKTFAVVGRVVNRDAERDLALIQLETVPQGVDDLPLAMRGARPGERVHSIGHRRDTEALWVHASGVVRTVCRTDEGYFWHGTKLAKGANVLVTQSPILEGDSGGPLVNDRGELVGVIAAVRWQTPSASVAIDVGEVRTFLAKAIPKAEPRDAPAEERAEHDPGPTTADQLLRATAWLRAPHTSQRGTGWLLDRKARWLVTSAQVVGGDDSVEAVFPVFRGGRAVVEYAHYRDRLADLRQTGQVVRGTVLARDVVRNLALVELTSIPDGAAELKLAATDPLPGKRIHTMSHPNNIEALWVYAAGAVRQVCRARLTTADGPEALAALLQLPGGGGDGGSPVVNDAGAVVAVTSNREAPQQLLGYAAAVSEVKTFLTESQPRWSPRDATAFRQRAELYVRTRQYPKATADLNEAIRLRPEDAELYVERARARRLSGDREAAFADCELAIRKNPKLASAFVERAAGRLADGETERAADDAREALRLDEKSVPAWAVLGEIGRARGDWEQALTACDKALDLDPNLSAAYLTRGRVFARKENLERAVIEFTRAVEFDPCSTEALRWRAEVYLRQGEAKRALADCAQLLESDPSDPRVLLLRGAIWVDLGDPQRAWHDRIRAIFLMISRKN